MAFIYNVTFDALDPARLSAFWADVTGYEVAESRDDFVRLRAPDSRGVRHILFFKVDDPTNGKNRMHVDLASSDSGAEVERLVELGASLADGRSNGMPVWRKGNGTGWVVMADPEGNEFCVG